MSGPALDEQPQVLEPVHAGQGEASGEIWATRLVLFLRLMAVVALVKGLYYWAIVCGVGAPSPQGFDSYAMPYQSATVFFAVIDLVAAVGLWLAAPWGRIWPIYGGRPWVIIVELALLGVYLSLALLAAREHSP